MKKFDIITLFPEMFTPYLSSSILGRAVNKKLVKFTVHNLRDFSEDKKHGKVDDRVYGGGPGMVIKIAPIVKAVEYIKRKNRKPKTKIVLFSPAGKQFDDRIARAWHKTYNHFIFICGHYEGIDERVKKILGPEEISVGPYVLSGGELPAMVVADAVSRKIKGVLGKEGSLEERRLGIGIPVYTRPESFLYKRKKYLVPKLLLKGNHAAIQGWRLEHKKV